MSHATDMLRGVSSAIASYVQPQKPEWKRYKQYTRKDIMSAIDAVKNGMSALQASRRFGVPSRTLYDKVKKMGIQTSRPFRRSNGSNGAAFPYGISGTSCGNASGMLFRLASEDESNPGAILEQQGLLQHALEIGSKKKSENTERDVMSMTPPPNAAVAAAAVATGSFSAQGLLQRALEIEERMKVDMGEREAMSMACQGNVSRASSSPAPNDRSPSPNLIKYAQRSRSLTPSPQAPPEDDYEDQVEDLSMSRKPEQQSRVIMPPMNQQTAAAMLATCSDSRRGD